MTTLELNAQIWRDMAEIADSEPLMKQLAKYLKKLVAKKSDPTLCEALPEDASQQLLELGVVQHVAVEVGKVNLQCTA